MLICRSAWYKLVLGMLKLYHVFYMRLYRCRTEPLGQHRCVYVLFYTFCLHPDLTAAHGRSVCAIPWNFHTLLFVQLLWKQWLRLDGAWLGCCLLENNANCVLRPRLFYPSHSSKIVHINSLCNEYVGLIY